MSNFATLTVTEFEVETFAPSLFQRIRAKWKGEKAKAHYRIRTLGFLTRLDTLDLLEHFWIKGHHFVIVNKDTHHDHHSGDLNHYTATEVGYSTKKPSKYSFQYEKSVSYPTGPDLSPSL